MKPSAVSILDDVSAELDLALGLLRGRRYSELDTRLGWIEARAGKILEPGALIRLRSALDAGLLSEGAVRARCDQLGRRLHFLSEVAQQVVQVELGITHIVETPADGAYDREGQVGERPSGRVLHRA